jgi:polyferredoxin
MSRKARQLPIRQRIRKGLLLASLLLFPATLYYFSPILIIKSSVEGVVNASFIVFGLMFFVSLFVGRLWCGWACPGGALQELTEPINSAPAPGGKANWIKWLIWVPWVILIAVLAIQTGGYRAVDPFYELEGGVTFLTAPVEGLVAPWYLVYYIVVAILAGLAVILGRRAACHTICWMAPFMILGRKLRNLGKWPSLRLVAAPSQCVDCRVCTRDCPMSLDVNGMVRRGDMEHSECILCGNCVDGCPKGAIHFSFRGGR